MSFFFSVSATLTAFKRLATIDVNDTLPCHPSNQPLGCEVIAPFCLRTLVVLFKIEDQLSRGVEKVFRILVPG